MRLEKLLSAPQIKPLVRSVAGSLETEVSDLVYDSRTAGAGALFFAVEGLRTDGHLFIDQSAASGAVAVVSERPAARHDITWITVSAVRPFMARCANEFFGSPSEAMDLVGITGTNGKTTTAFLVHEICRQEGPSMMMGTIKTVIDDGEVESRLTTPESVDIQRTLAEAVSRRCRYGVLEVSSHALHFFRVFGSSFPVAVFTNLTQDHLDFHRSLESYFQAKRLLFSQDYNPGLRVAVINEDDPYGQRLIPEIPVEVVTYGVSETSAVHPVSVQHSSSGLSLEIRLHGRLLPVESPLVGTHNVYNILAACAACDALGIPDERVKSGIRAAARVPGRFERVDVATPFTVIIDYAHTPNALENVLSLARKVCRGRVICVFGCGGDRDKAKRPLMGALAVRDADLAIVTSDNPRTEEPVKIIEQILTGVPEGSDNYLVIPDRREAITRALALARDDDLVLLAGKGHETYQITGTEKRPFDERAIVREALCLK